MILLYAIAWWVDRRWPRLSRITWRLGEVTGSEPDGWDDQSLHEMGVV